MRRNSSKEAGRCWEYIKDQYGHKGKGGSSFK